RAVAGRRLCRQRRGPRTGAGLRRQFFGPPAPTLDALVGRGRGALLRRRNYPAGATATKPFLPSAKFFATHLTLACGGNSQISAPGSYPSGSESSKLPSGSGVACIGRQTSVPSSSSLTYTTVSVFVAWRPDMQNFSDFRSPYSHRRPR